jgi:hypothetical protein
LRICFRILGLQYPFRHTLLLSIMSHYSIVSMCSTQLQTTKANKKNQETKSNEAPANQAPIPLTKQKKRKVFTYAFAFINLETHIVRWG